MFRFLLAFGMFASVVVIGWCLYPLPAGMEYDFAALYLIGAPVFVAIVTVPAIAIFGGIGLYDALAYITGKMSKSELQDKLINEINQRDAKKGR